MFHKLSIGLSFFALLTAGSAVVAQSVKPIAVESGVSYPLAQYRSKAVSNLQYDIHLNIPKQKVSAIQGEEKLSFILQQNDQPLQLDFKQLAYHIQKVVVNKKVTTVNLQQEHLIIDKQLLKIGSNEIEITFTAGNESLNRNNEYLYALFVPDHARNTFPCFDQPDLKARFLLTLTIPNGWNALSNGKILSVRPATGQAAQTVTFANSDKLSTYLFSFTAGKYKSVNKPVGSRTAEFLHRETDSSKVKLSTDSIFIAHINALSFLEQWTGIPYPFQKVGFVAIPDFQFGGMEHPGEVQYKASSLFLDDGATKDQFISRANLISHETAHMWFGDLVTMQWFNDVWMKEVFANFMADKVTEKMMGSETFNLKFLQDHYPAAYGVDRTTGANPIRQQLDNLQEAGSMYGNIIYHKAPIMMRQLEMLMGKENFRSGIREYLKRFSYSNATWNDLIAILSKHTKFNLHQWNQVWVNQPGRPVFDYNIAYQSGKISAFTINQKPENGSARTWPQAFQVMLVYANSVKTVDVNMTGADISLKEAVGLAKPDYLLFNSSGIGYGLFPTDKQMLPKLYRVSGALPRASAYIAAYENMLAGRNLKPQELLQIFTQGLTQEKDEMNLRLITGYLTSIYWNFIQPSVRQDLSVSLENALWQAIAQQPQPNHRKILFRAYQDVFLSKEAYSNLYQVWKRQQPPAGVKLSEDDYTSLASSLALRSDAPAAILQEQQERIKNADRKQRLAFLMPALSNNQQERDNFFASLADRKNRQKEAWVLSALSYLHHPLRQNTSVKYIPKSLAMVEEIQQTGDIFFPQSWLSATLGSYQSTEAAQNVREFLQAHPNYNPKLKGKILQAADNVLRAEKLLQ
ncbi:M1 family aminopeptidase [Mucilaginibacter sp. CSA2-8R]|uniref:M1 family aminopeptidase n=1 Tax=Mucilaginibacter sp. CSA2-8R TaxID=3141542 RepID=UPI00315D59F9